MEHRDRRHETSAQQHLADAGPPPRAHLDCRRPVVRPGTKTVLPPHPELARGVTAVDEAVTCYPNVRIWLPSVADAYRALPDWEPLVGTVVPQYQ